MGSILTLDSQLTERGLEDAPKLSLFIVGPGGSLHSRKASELAQDPSLRSCALLSKPEVGKGPACLYGT